MAEGTFIEVVEGVIGKSGNLADQTGLLSCVRDELEKLRNTVSTIKPVVSDAEEKQEVNRDVSEWLRRLKDAVYVADNSLEEFSAEVTRRDLMTQNKEAKKVCISFPNLNQLAFDLKLGRNIKAIRMRLEVISADRMSFNLEEHLGETWVERPTQSCIPDEGVIGRENDKKEIIRLLLDPNIKENIAVLPIVAMGGMGKTTLARLVFNDDEFSKNFERKVWLNVGDVFDGIKIMKGILAHVKGGNLENLHENELINGLHKEIDGKKYLLVLDDMWNENYEKWIILMDVLQGGARGSRILVTTRSARVARITQTIEPYTLWALSSNESWLLLESCAFNEGEEPDSRIKEIGMKIVERCGGLPLAIRSMGGILNGRRDVSEWLFFMNNELSKIMSMDNEILAIVKLSYDHLPSHMRQCIAYCSLFPKDYNIKKQTLIGLWMAQGFIKLSHPNQCLEDVGHEYFIELLSRSFFHEVEEDKRGNISFKIHDIIHDLLLFVARQENTVIGINGEHIANAERTRHLSFGIHLSPSCLSNPLFQTSNLRTFLLCGQQSGEHENLLNESTCDAIFSHFKFLRVLDFHGTGIKTVPSSISDLNHVRYLDLSDNRLIEMLPQSLSRLLNLQTLKLSGCVRLKELPRDISKLVNLRALEIDGCRDLTHMPCGLGQLTNLHSLSQFTMSKDTSSVSRQKGELKELNTLKNLRGTLEIVNLRHGKDAEAESKATNLKGIEHLQALELRWIEDKVDKENAVFDKMSLEALQPHPNLKFLSLYRYGGVIFPTWLPSLTNLVKFELSGCQNLQHLPPLYQLPSLKVLELDSLPALEYISHSEEELSNSSFLQSLEELKVVYCPNLKGWWQRRDSIKEFDDNDHSVRFTTTSTLMAENHLPPSFPQLTKLCIRACPELFFLPLFPFLKKLELYCCSFNPLKQTTRMAATTAAVPSTSSSSSTHAISSFVPLSNLKSMEIGQMREPLPEECMQNLISLEHLRIYECHGLLQGIQHLTALKQLDIFSSEVFDLPNDGNGMEWQGLGSLTSLQSLEIVYCPSLLAIPEWICNLTSLQTLRILECPILSKRCEREVGEDWGKIAHIPDIRIDRL